MNNVCAIFTANKGAIKNYEATLLIAVWLQG